MKFDEALYRFKREIEKEYGPKAADGLLKVTLTHELFDTAIISLWKDQTLYGSYVKMRYAPSSMNDLKLEGVRIEARAALGEGK